MVSPYSAPVEIQQHNLMALNWVQLISQSLNAFTNNEIDPVKKGIVYDALGWGGLEDTDIFNLRPDK